MRSVFSMLRSEKKERGFTLVELVVALAVVGVLISSFVVTTTMIDSGRASNALQSIRTLADAAIQFYAAHPTTRYANISMTALSNEGFIPSTMASNGVNPWGGNYTIAPINSDNNFRITLTNVPDSATSGKLTDPLTNRATGSYDATTKVTTLDFDK